MMSGMVISTTLPEIRRVDGKPSLPCFEVEPTRQLGGWANSFKSLPRIFPKLLEKYDSLGFSLTHFLVVRNNLIMAK